jgi:hypothetical protein
MRASARKFIAKTCAVFTVLCVSCVYVLAVGPSTPGLDEAAASAPLPQESGKLMTTKNQPITVNGNSTTPGTSILSGSSIQTPAGVGATLQLGASKLDIAPNTQLSIQFTGDGNATVTLIEGCLILRVGGDALGTVITPDGKSTQTSPTDKVIDVCYARGAAAPVINQGAAASAGAGAGGGGVGGAVSGAAGGAAGGGGGGVSGAVLATLIGIGVGGTGLFIALSNRGGSTSPASP